MFVAAPLLLLATAIAPAEAPLDLGALVREATDRHPEVLAAQKRFEALSQRPRAASALPDPMVGIGWNSSGNPLPGAGLGREPVANIGVMVTQEFPYPGKRGLRAQMATKEAQAERAAYESARLAVASRVKQAYYRLQHTQAMLEVIARNRAVLDRMRLAAEVRYSAGKGMQQEILRTQTQLSILEVQRIQFETMQQTAEAQLNAALGRPPGSPLGRAPEAEVHETLPAFDNILAHARENAPMLLRDQRMIERAEAGLQMARKEWYPDFALTAGYYNMGAMPSMYMFRADVSIPIWGTKQRAGITEQANTVAQQRRTYQATEHSLAARLREDYAMAESALKLMSLYAKTVIPQANLTTESALASYQSGVSDFLPVLQNFMTSVEYEMNYHQQMEQFHMALSRMEEMSGMQLTHAGGAK